MSESPNNNSKATIIVTIVTVIGGIITAIVAKNNYNDNHQVNPVVSAPVAKAANMEPERFRPGIYVSDPDDDGNVYFVKFNPEKKVIVAGDFHKENDSVADVRSWLRDKDHYKHDYFFNEDTVVFKGGSPGDIWHYDGVVLKDGSIELRAVDPDGNETSTTLNAVPL